MIGNSVSSCLFCGRDTQATSQICRACSTRGGNNMPSEERDRPMLHCHLQAMLSEYEEYEDYDANELF